MFGRVWIKKAVGIEHPFFLAESSIQKFGNETFAFVMLAPNRYQKRLVDLGKKIDNGFLVISGIKCGDRVGKLSSREISATVQVDGAVHLYGVPGELRQVLANLLSNAIDASPAKSEVTIRVKETRAGAQVTIADRGAGIPEESRAQIFEPFFTTKKDVGTGLGLWISKQILQNQGGSIRFRSRNGGGRSGTVFVVYLSKKDAATSTAA